MREEGFEDGSRAPESCGSPNPEEFSGFMCFGVSLWMMVDGERERRKSLYMNVPLIHPI